jgi:Spy/CpxP family protein refolding chaperone
MEDREVKALSAEEIQGLLAGEGLGFALAAELNGLPGPKHVLELADALGLSADQRRRVEGIRESMSERARELGKAVVDAETHLDRMFDSGHATPSAVREATVDIGRLRGELRAAHLVAHLATAQELTPEQVAEYARLRGYAPTG